MKKEDILIEIERLTKIKNDNSSEEQAVKILLNSAYGAIASPFFIAYNTDVAESITLQGQDLIKYSEKIINKYFTEVWHLDKDIHTKMNIETPSKILINDLIIAGDTDSNFLTFQPMFDSIKENIEDKIDFILKFYKLRLKDYLNNCFNIYAKKFGVENIQEFEMENISRTAIWVAKKKYVLNIAWKDPGIFYKNLEAIKPKGVEVVQSSTPLFARKKIIELLKYLLDDNVIYDEKQFNQKIKQIKSEFMLSKIEDISKGSSIGDYEKYILKDNQEFTYGKGCPIHLRASGYYNYLLNKSEQRSKYLLIKTGDKVKWYFTKNLDNDNFAYLPNNYPIEFAPEIDYDRQFVSVIIDPINRFLTAAGKNLMTPTLSLVKSLF